jgi:hypothetical protein
MRLNTAERQRDPKRLMGFRGFILRPVHPCLCFLKDQQAQARFGYDIVAT